MSEPLIGNKPNDNKIDVPSIKVKEPTSQAEFTAILEEASKAHAKPVQQKPTTEPVRTPVTTDSRSIDVPPVVPSSDVPSDVIDSIAGQREPGTYSPLVSPGEPLQQERPTLRLPVYPQQDFNTPSADVQPYQGQQVYSTADPLVFGNTVSDERFNHWVSEAQKQATQMRPTDMLSQAFRVPQLDPSVSGGFAPTSQNQPWWGSPEQTEGYYDKQTGRWVQLKRNDFNIFKGKFGEFGQGLIGGGMQLLNIPQAVVQGGIADAANIFGALGSGLDKSGGLFGAIMNPGKFAQAVGQTWQQNSPVSQGQAPLTDANPSGFFQQLRNNSYTVAGLSGRNTTGTNSRRDASGRVEPFGQLYEKPSTLALPGREGETTTLGLGITQGTNVRRERNTVDEVAIRAATALVPGISEAERQRRQQDYLSKDDQLGGVFRGLGVDIVTGGLGEKLLGGLVQGATRQTTRQAVREVVVTRKPLPEVPKLPPGRTASPTRRLPPAQGINNPAYQLPPANRGLRQAPEVLEVKPVEPRVIVTPPSGRDEFGRIIADDKPVVQQPDRLVKTQRTALPGTPERPTLPETTQPRPSVEPEPPIYVVSGDGSVQGTFRDGKPYRPIDLGEATFDKVNTTVRIKPEDVPTVEVEALTVPYTELPPSAFTVSDTRVFKRRVSRPDAVEVLTTDITGELRPKLEGTDPNAPRLNPSPDEELKIPFQAYDKQGVPLPELQRTPEQIINGMVDGVDSLFKEYEDVLKRAEDQRLLSPAREFTTADLTRKALPEGTSPKLLDELNAPGKPLPTLKAREPLPDLRKLDKASEDIIDQIAKGLVSLDDGLKKLNELDKAKETTDLLRQAGYVQTEPGVIQSQAAQVNQKVRKVVRATDKETPVVSPLLKAPEALKVVDAEVFSPQYSLADFAKLVTREQAGAVYNPNAMKRGERTVASLIEVGKRITLPDGTTLLPGDTKPSTVNTFAKLNRKIERALESAGVPMQDRTYYRQIFSRNGIPIPENLPDDLIIRVGKAKPDGTPETLAVSSKPKQDVTPTLPLSEDYGVAVMMTYRDGKLVPTDRQPMKVMPAVGERNWKPWVYQKDLPAELVSKSPEGLDLTVRRAEVETNIAQLSDEYQAAKVNLEAVSKELNNALTKLDKVPDAGGRTLLDDPVFTKQEQVVGNSTNWLVDGANDGSPMFHGTRVNDLDLAKADPVKGASRSELGTAIYLTKNVDEATAKAVADVNRHLPMLSGRSFGDGVVHETRIKPTAVIIKDTHLLDDDMKRIFLDAAESTYGFEHPKVVRALDKALNKEGVTIKQAYALLDKAVLKFTGDVVEKELLTTQRDIVSQLRMYGIDGVSSADTVAIYNPDVIKTVARTGIGEVEDTLEHAVARLNVDSLAASRNPESPFLKASHAESKVRTLSELQEIAERELKQAQERLVDEVNKLADIDNELEGLSLSERNKLRQEALDADKRTYESFKRELNKPNDTNCL
ncbi:tail fiber protein [Leptolyngbya phage LPP-2, strain SPI]|uniref:Tail fiber protein n=1 Tax=Leptolyngbya phage LPP-2, strain SPI TaxID=2996053 RepID=A0AAE9PZ57_9CAUD|nr:tail fiber protein [Leptolyngbya phage LPP-2 st. SPI]